jgi:hypothetical protein
LSLISALMSQIRDHCNPIEPLAISSDGNDSYPEAMLETPMNPGRGSHVTDGKQESIDVKIQFPMGNMGKAA